MSFWDTAKGIGNTFLKYNPGTALAYQAIDKGLPALKSGVKWLGAKPQGAQDLNDQLNSQLTNAQDPNSKLGQFINSYNPGGHDTRFDSTLNALSGYTNDMRGQLEKIRGRSDQAYDDAYKGFQGFTGPLGGMDPGRVGQVDSNISSLKPFQQYGAGSQKDANAVKGNGIFDKFAQTGAGSESERQGILGNGVFSQFANTGAGSDEQKQGILANGTYDEFNRTGGLSADDIANMRTRGNSTGSSIFAGLTRNNATGAAIRGGGPGYGASQARLARDAARSANEASMNTELGITDQRNKGREWGAAGLTGANQTLAGNQMAGASALSDANQKLSGNRMAGASALSDGQKSLIANQLAATGMSSDQQMKLLDVISGNKKFGVSGLSSLYSTPGADLGYQNDVTQGYSQQGNMIGQSANNDQNNVGNYLKALGMQNDQVTNILAILNGRNPNTSNFDKYGMPILSAATGIGSTLLSGGANRAVGAGSSMIRNAGNDGSGG